MLALTERSGVAIRGQALTHHVPDPVDARINDESIRSAARTTKIVYRPHWSTLKLNALCVLLDPC
jgi:hypothetical protein